MKKQIIIKKKHSIVYSNVINDNYNFNKGRVEITYEWIHCNFFLVGKFFKWVTKASFGWKNDDREMIMWIKKCFWKWKEDENL